MLDRCAPGYTAKQMTHNWCVRYAGKTFHRLPTGKHGRRENPQIQVGHVKQMVNLFGVKDCAGREIQLLR